MIYIVTIYKNYYDHYGYTRSIELQYGAHTSLVKRYAI